MELGFGFATVSGSGRATLILFITDLAIATLIYGISGGSIDFETSMLYAVYGICGFVGCCGLFVSIVYCVQLQKIQRRTSLNSENLSSSSSSNQNVPIQIEPETTQILMPLPLPSFIED